MASPTSPNAKRYAIVTRVSGLIRLLSMEYLTPIPRPIIKTRTPILLIKFSPMNFSRSTRADSEYLEKTLLAASRVEPALASDLVEFEAPKFGLAVSD